MQSTNNHRLNKPAITASHVHAEMIKHLGINTPESVCVQRKEEEEEEKERKYKCEEIIK